MTRVFDSAGRELRLGRELGRGGEGVVYDLVGDAAQVVKVYARPPDRRLAAKLAAMVGMADEKLLRIAAWPTGTVHDAKGTVIGFTMPRIDGHRPVFQLYGPKLRLREFPKADWAFLIHAAANAARAFAVVHAAGHVIGDVNFNNLVVGADATVRLLDCDSFQVRQGGQTWFCSVGVGTHQPPELQSVASYDGILRTPNHDRFGLAVIIFQILCLGRHPFTGRFLGSGNPPTIEEAIAAGRYAFGADQRRTMMAPPAASLPMEALTPRVRALFEQAFSLAAKAGGRPEPEAWIAALDELARSLTPCSVNRGHLYRRGLAACPWCMIEAASGAPLFPAIFVTTGSAQPFVALWQQVQSISMPPRVEPPAVPRIPEVNPSSAISTAAEMARRFRAGAYLALMLALFLTVAVTPSSFVGLIGLGLVITFAAFGNITPPAEAAALRQRVAALEQAWAAAVEEAKAVAALSENGKLPWQIDGLKTRLLNLKPLYDALPAERARRLERLAESARDRQLHAYLDGFPIAQARIKRISQAAVATLSAHGIDTAADIDEARISAIPGFGPIKTRRLVDWRREVEKGFAFDPTRGPDPASVAQVEREIAQERARLHAELSAGLAQLQVLVRSTEERRRAAEARREDVARQLGSLALQLAQARADAAAFPTDLAASKARVVLGVVASALLILVALPTLHKSRPPPLLLQNAPSLYPPPAPPPLVPAPEQRLLPSIPEARQPQLAQPTPSPAPHASAPPEPTIPRAAAPRSPEPLAPIPEPDLPRLPPLAPRGVPPASSQPEPSIVSPRAVPPPSPTPASARERAATRQGANVRDAPRGDAAIVRVVPQGTVLSVFDRRGTWVQVGDTAPWGWIHASLLEPR